MTGFREFADYNYQIKKLKNVIEIGKGIHEFEINPSGSKKIIIIGGIHGDEQSGPHGIIAYAQNEPKPKNNLIFIPCANIYGFKNNVRTNADKIDINRHFKSKDEVSESKLIWDRIKKHKPDFVVALHEVGYETAFVYCQSKKSPCELTSVAKLLVKEIEKQFPIHKGRLLDGPFKKICTTSKQGVVGCSDTNKGTLEDELLKINTPSITTELPQKANLTKKVKLTMKLIELIGE